MGGETTRRNQCGWQSMYDLHAESAITEPLREIQGMAEKRAIYLNREKEATERPIGDPEYSCVISSKLRFGAANMDMIHNRLGATLLELVYMSHQGQECPCPCRKISCVCQEMTQYARGVVNLPVRHWIPVTRVIIDATSLQRKYSIASVERGRKCTETTEGGKKRAWP